LPKRGAKKKSGCTTSRRRSRHWKGQQKELAAALEDPATYTSGGHAIAINRDLSALTHDLARLTAEWESVTASATGRS